MGEIERHDEEPRASAARSRRHHDDRRTSTVPPEGDDPRDIDDEFSRDDRLEVTLKQDMLNGPRQGQEGMGTSSDRAPGTDLDEAPARDQ